MGLVLGSAIGIIVAVLLFIAFVALLATGLAQGKSWSEFKAGYISAIVTGVLALFVGAVSIVILRRSTAVGRKGLEMSTALLGDYQRQQQQAALRAQQQAYFDQGRALQVGDNPSEAIRQYERAQATRQMQEEAFRLAQQAQPTQSSYVGGAYTPMPPPYVAQQPTMPFSPPPQALPPPPSTTQMAQQPTFYPAQTTMPQQQAKPLPPVPATVAASSAGTPQSAFQRFTQAGKTAIAAAPGAIDTASQLAGVAAQAAGPKYARQAEQFQQGAARARQTALQAQEAQRILEQQQQQWRAAQQQARA